jgi:hypothetical protein
MQIMIYLFEEQWYQWGVQVEKPWAENEKTTLVASNTFLGPYIAGTSS